MSNQVMDRWDEYWCDDHDDYEDCLPRGKGECPKCGDIVPESHLDTDSGNCISCEDAEDEISVMGIYDMCLLGLQPKKKTNASPKCNSKTLL